MKRMLKIGILASTATIAVFSAATIGVIEWKNAREKSNKYVWGKDFTNKLEEVEHSGNKVYQVIVNGEMNIFTTFEKAVEAIGYKKVDFGYEKNGKIFREFSDLKQFGINSASNVSLNEYAIDDPTEAINVKTSVLVDGIKYTNKNITEIKDLGAKSDWFPVKEAESIYTTSAVPSVPITNFTHKVNGVDSFWQALNNEGAGYITSDQAISMNSIINTSSLPVENSGSINYIGDDSKTVGLTYFSETDPENPSIALGAKPQAINLNAFGALKSGDIFIDNGHFYKFLEKEDTPGYTPPFLNNAVSIQEYKDHPMFQQKPAVSWSTRVYKRVTGDVNAQAVIDGKYPDALNINVANGITVLKSIFSADAKIFGAVPKAGKTITVYSGGYSNGTSLFATEKPYSFIVNDGTTTVKKTPAEMKLLKDTLFESSTPQSVLDELFDERPRDISGNGYRALPNTVVPSWKVRTMPEVGKVWMSTDGRLWSGPTAVPGNKPEIQPTAEGFHEISSLTDDVKVGSAARQISASVLSNAYSWIKNTPQGVHVFTSNQLDPNTGYVSDAKVLAGWYKKESMISQESLYTKADEQQNPLFKEGTVKIPAVFSYSSTPQQISFANTHYFYDGRTSTYVKNKNDVIKLLNIIEKPLSAISKTMEFKVNISESNKQFYVFVTKTKSQLFPEKMVSPKWDGTLAGLSDDIVLSEEEFKKCFYFDPTQASSDAAQKLSGDELFFTNQIAAISAGKVNVLNRNMYLSDDGQEIFENSPSSLLTRIGILIFNKSLIDFENVIYSQHIYIDKREFHPVLSTK